MPHNRMVREPEQKKPLAVIRANVLESAANTYTDVDISTPVSAAYFQAMRIHKVVFGNEFPDTVEDTQTILDMHVSTQDHTGVAGLDVAEPGMIASYRQVRRWMSSAAGGEGEVIVSGLGTGKVWDFGEQGLLVTDGRIHLGVKGTANTNVKRATVAIYYTLETLEPDEYIAALTTLGADL